MTQKNKKRRRFEKIAEGFVVFRWWAHGNFDCCYCGGVYYIASYRLERNYRKKKKVLCICVWDVENIMIIIKKP